MIEFLTIPLPQDPAYHLFADQRTFFGVPHFWNVASNLPFLVVGALGLRESARHQDDPLHTLWNVFFAGIFLTAFGSGYFHLEPNNETLAWDRLTMTIGFMGFVGIVIGEYVSKVWARRLLLPLLVIGAASVLYWLHTEQVGAGDLRPYAAVQFLPMVLVPAVVLLRRDRSDLGKYIGWMIAFYVAAKFLEHYDRQVYAIGELMSGHALKHIVAAIGTACLLLALYRRRRDR